MATAGALKWVRSKMGTGGDEDAQIDAKTPVRLGKIIQRLIQYTHNKKLNLKNSPPYLQGIAIDIQDLVNKTFDPKSNPVAELKDNEYLGLAVQHIVAHSKKVIKLFKDAKEDMENVNSAYRRQLNKLTLVYSHILAEFRTIFRDGKFQDNFKIVKQDPREFWSRVFQKRVIVSWDEFMENFSVVHATRTHEERLALKKTIDILENNYVSWFEFDIFTRLFQPWAQIINNWNVIVVRHTAYCAFMTYDEVQAILGKHTNKPGSYVFRLSCTRLGQWAIGFVTQKNTIVQTIPQSKSLYQALIDGAQEGCYLYPKGEDRNPDIRQNIMVAPEEHIKVSKEQYDIYCDIESTFEMCKICDANIKSMRIDPCGHLLCKTCLTTWMEQGRGKRGNAPCPFCRVEIMSTEQIVVEPYKAPAQAAHKEDALPARPPRSSAPAPDLPPRVDRSSRPLPVPHGSGRPVSGGGDAVDPHALAQMQEMGFAQQTCVQALTVAKGDISVAIQIALQSA